MDSPTKRPNAAPILNTGIKIPDGTGIVEANIEKKNCKQKYELLFVDVSKFLAYREQGVASQIYKHIGVSC